MRAFVAAVLDCSTSLRGFRVCQGPDGFVSHESTVERGRSSGVVMVTRSGQRPTKNSINVTTLIEGGSTGLSSARLPRMRASSVMK